MEEESNATELKYVSLEGKHYLVGCFTTNVKVWSEEGKRLQTHVKHTAPSIVENKTHDVQHYFKGTTTVKDSTTGKELIAVGDSVGSIYFIESLREGIFQNEIVYQLKPEVAIHALAECRASNLLIVADAQGSVHLLTLKGKSSITLTKTIDCKTDNTPITAMKVIYNKGENLLIISDYLGKIRLVNLLTQKIMIEIAAHARMVTTLDYDGEKSLIVSGSEDTFINVWGLEIDAGNLSNTKITLKKSIPLENQIVLGAQFLRLPTRTVVAVASHEQRTITLINNLV